MKKEEFKKVAEFIEEMKATSSTNDKKEILKKYDSLVFRKLFEYVYSPFKKYYVTSDNLKKRIDLSIDNYSDLFALLDDLNERRITGHAAIQAVNGFIENNKEFSEIIYDVIDRNLKTRATATLINSVFPETVPTFDVALAEKFKGNEKKVNFDSGEWWASRKLDGCRCITLIDELGDITFFSRGGKEFLTLDVLRTDILKLNLKSKVLDGEMCIMKDDGLEDFQGIIKEIGRKDHTILKPMYHVFDILELEEFEKQSGNVSFVARQIILNLIVEKLTYAKVLPQIKIDTKEHFEELVADAISLGYEGIMLRKDVGYEGKRSSNLLKVKEMQDAEYKVVNLESAVQRIIDCGKEIEELMLKSVIIEHKGNTVNVGSGFTIEERQYYHKNPNEILGKIITVQYFGETTDQYGKHSLRFPVLKVIHGKNREF